MAKKEESNTKFSLVDEVLQGVLEVAEADKNGTVKLKRTDVKKVLEVVFEKAMVAAAGGERIRFPSIGILSRGEIAARKAGKGINPFTKEPMVIKARPASKKPRWTFPKTTKEVFANKKYW